jgi:hypothetical protein
MTERVPAGPEHELEVGKDPLGLGEVFENETDEDVVEGGCLQRPAGDGQGAGVGLEERHVSVVRDRRDVLAGAVEGGCGDVDRGDVAAGAALSEDCGLGADAAADLEDALAGAVARVVVEELGEAVGLVAQPGVFDRWPWTYPPNIRTAPSRRARLRPHGVDAGDGTGEVGDLGPAVGDLLEGGYLGEGHALRHELRDLVHLPAPSDDDRAAVGALVGK